MLRALEGIKEFPLTFSVLYFAIAFLTTFSSLYFATESEFMNVFRTERAAVTKQTTTQYLQQNTEEMDLLRSSDVTRRKGKQNDRLWKKREGKDTGWDRGLA